MTVPTEGIEVGGVLLGGAIGAALGGLLGGLLGHPGWGMLAGVAAGGGVGFVGGKQAAGAISNAASSVKSSFGGDVPKQLSATFGQTGTSMSMNVGDSLTVYLPGPSPWSFSQTDPSVLSQGSPGTATDPSNTLVTDQTTPFAAVATGATVLTGTSGSQTWKLTVNVST